MKVWDIADHDKYLVKGRVRHSQKFSETPLSCWIIINKNGEICCAHCNCMAGLGEVCTHVAALLFYLEAVARLQGKETCTQQICQWILPSFLKNAQYLPISDIDFTSAVTKKRKLDDAIDNVSNSTSQLDSLNTTPVKVDSSTATVTKTPLPSYQEMNCFYESISKSKSNPAILSLVKPFSDKFVPSLSLSEFPSPLTTPHKLEYLSLSYIKLLEVCESIEVRVTDSEAMAIHNKTVTQFQSKLWFRYRAGRITASRMKSVCRTDSSNPSQSLIKIICYPEQFSFKTKATSWGCSHEKAARRQYIASTKTKHHNFSIEDSGLVINPRWSHIGATPDGKVDCDCCGLGVVEIKCPFCHKNETIEHATKDKHFCLKKDSGDQVHLDRNHAYYYQVQTQMFVCNVEYCDFVVCTFSDADGLHIERVTKNSAFWSDCLSRAESFFRVCVLPELLGKWYTRSIAQNTTVCDDSINEEGASTSSNVGRGGYCYCNGPDEGAMIACDNTKCMIEWFHINCLKIDSTPRGKWYCPDCRKLAEFSRSCKKRTEVRDEL